MRRHVSFCGLSVDSWVYRATPEHLQGCGMGIQFQNPCTTDCKHWILQHFSFVTPGIVVLKRGMNQGIPRLLSLPTAPS